MNFERALLLCAPYDECFVFVFAVHLFWGVRHDHWFLSWVVALVCCPVMGRCLCLCACALCVAHEMHAWFCL